MDFTVNEVSENPRVTDSVSCRAVRMRLGFGSVAEVRGTWGDPNLKQPQAALWTSSVIVDSASSRAEDIAHSVSVRVSQLLTLRRLYPDCSRTLSSATVNMMKTGVTLIPWCAEDHRTPNPSAWEVCICLVACRNYVPMAVDWPVV